MFAGQWPTRSGPVTRAAAREAATLGEWVAAFRYPGL